jgi:uncharacterized membrane protein
MNKEQFLSAVCEKYKNASALERSRAVDYYAEMIDDRIEDGMSEEQAVAAMGDIAEFAGDFDEAFAKKPMSRARLAVVAALSPISIILLISFWSIIWALVIAFYAVIVVLYTGVICASALAFRYFTTLTVYEGLLFLGGAFICLGFAVFFCALARFVNKGAVRLTKFLWRLAFGREVYWHE